jgi:cobalt-zinc-cadmium efflux system outer membrane protein
MPVRIMKAFPLLFLAVACGCASFQSEPLSPSRTAAELESRTLASPGLRTFVQANLHRELTPWPPESWDLTLLTLAAFYYHPDLDVARAQWGVKKAGVITAGGRPNPSAAFTPQYHADPRGLAPWTLMFSLDVPVETAGKRGYRIEKAEHLSASARMNIAETAWRIRSRLREALLSLYQADGTKCLLGQQEEIRREIFGLLQRRSDLGEDSVFVVTQADIALQHTRLALLEAEKEVARSRAELAAAIGLQPEAVDGANMTFDFLRAPSPPVPSKDLMRQALLHRADILALLSEYEAAQSALRFDVAKQYPDIHLGPGYSWDQGDNEWSLGFSLTLPVFNRNQGPIAEAVARRKEVAARFTSRQAAIIGEIGGAAAAYRGSIRKLEGADALVSAQRNKLMGTEARYRSGEEDLLSLLGAELELSSAEQSHLDTFTEAQRYAGLLEDALQQPLDSSETPAANVETDPRQKEVPNK